MAITDFKSLLGREPVDGDQVRVWRFITSDVEPKPVQQVTLTFRLGLFRADEGYLPPSALFSTKESAERAYVAWLLADDVSQYAETTAADVDKFVEELHYELKQAYQTVQRVRARLVKYGATAKQMRAFEKEVAKLVKCERSVRRNLLGAPRSLVQAREKALTPKAPKRSARAFKRA